MGSCCQDPRNVVELDPARHAGAMCQALRTVHVSNGDSAYDADDQPCGREAQLGCDCCHGLWCDDHAAVPS